MKIHSNWLKNTLHELQKLLTEERKICVQILELLLEIERRKSYAELGYDGLYSFCIRELKFTESQAFQRIQAMRALKSTPEIKEKLKSGTMSVSTVAQVQVFLRQEAQQKDAPKRTREDRASLFTQFENKTSREVKTQIAELKGEKFKTKLNLELDEEAEQLWKSAREQTAHQSHSNELQCFKIVLSEWLENKNAPFSRSKLAAKTKASTTAVPRRNISWSTKPAFTKPAVSLAHTQPGSATQQPIPTPSITQPTKAQVRYVPLATKREVFNRDQHQCKNCGSKYALTLEHIIPYAKNGTHHPKNLIVLCRNCNLHQGVKEFGLETMRR